MHTGEQHTDDDDQIEEAPVLARARSDRGEAADERVGAIAAKQPTSASATAPRQRAK